MKNAEFFLWRLVNSLTSQTFKNWELIITKDGKMAENTNSGINQAHGEFIKPLYLDDYFAHEYALQAMVEEFGDDDEWLIAGADTNPHPFYTDDIETGNNKLGSPSALMFRNHFKDNLLFDERMSWLLDCDLYKRFFQTFGLPQLLSGVQIMIGTGDHQMTNILTPDEKLSEHKLIKQKYA